MKRAISLAVLISTLVGGSAVAGTSGRTVERPYQPVEADPTLPEGSVKSTSSVTFRTRATERSVTVAIQDDSGLTVPGEVRQDVDGDGEADMVEEFCGSTPDAIAVEPGVPVTVVRITGSCTDVTDPTGFGTWTKGTVTATFAK